MPIPDIIAPIAAQHTSLSSQSQPQLFWFLSSAWQGPVYFTLNQVGKIEPLLDIELLPQQREQGFKAGYHSISLAKQNISLQENVEYEWFVYLILDPVERSADFLASATLMFKKPTAQQLEVINDTEITQRYFIYAEQAYWHDAMSSLFQLLSKPLADVDKQYLLAHRTSLLKQVKMPKLAEFDY